MKFLKCIVCKGEVDIINNDHSTNKKIKCNKCGFTNSQATKEPEIIVIRKMPSR